MVCRARKIHIVHECEITLRFEGTLHVANARKHMKAPGDWCNRGLYYIYIYAHNTKNMWQIGSIERRARSSRRTSSSFRAGSSRSAFGILCGDFLIPGGVLLNKAFAAQDAAVGKAPWLRAQGRGCHARKMAQCTLDCCLVAANGHLASA